MEVLAKWKSKMKLPNATWKKLFSWQIGTNWGEAVLDLKRWPIWMHECRIFSMKFNFQAKSKNKFQSSSKDEMENSSKDDLKLIKRCLQHLIQWWCPKLIKGSDLDVRWLGWVRKLTRLRLVEWQDSGLLNDNGTLADQFSQLVQLSVLTACPIISSQTLSKNNNHLTRKSTRS